MIFLAAVLAGLLLTPSKVATQLPGLLYGASSGVPQTIKSTSNALWVSAQSGGTPMTPANGGTGQDSSAWSALTKVTAGVWAQYTGTTCTNQFVTVLSALGVATCTTPTLTGAQFANQGTTTTVLHGNAAGNPTFAAVSLTADVSGVLPVANGGTNEATYFTWTTPAFNAAHYTASAGDWTVESADVTTFAYTIAGKTMWVMFRINTTTVSATPGRLSILIPASKVVAKGMFHGGLDRSDDGTTFTGGNVAVEASGTTIDLYKFGGSGWATSTNTTYARGEVFFEIQ